MSILFLFFDAFSSILRTVHSGWFEWWLKPLMEREAERWLKKEIRRELSFLFDKFGTRFVDTPKRYRWGTIVTLEAGNLLVQIASDRGEYFLNVAPSNGPTECEPISARRPATATRQVYVSKDSTAFLPFASLSELALILELKFDLLEKAYSSKDHTNTWQRLDEILNLSDARRYIHAHHLLKQDNGYIQTLGL